MTNMKIVIIFLLAAIAQVGLSENILFHKLLQNDKILKHKSGLEEINISNNVTDKGINNTETLDKAEEKTYRCDFEDGLCSFLSNSYENKYGWILGTGKQNRTEPGPSIDNTLGNEHGSYLFVNLTAARMASVQLQTVTLKEVFCLRFFYYLSGAEVSMFTVTAANIDQDYRLDKYYYLNKQKEEKGGRWIEVVLSIFPSSSMKSIGYQVLFELRKISDTSTKLVVALDDIELNRGYCPEQKIKADFLCTFDSYDCGYSLTSSPSPTWNWKRVYDSSKFFDKQPDFDHTLDTKYGGFWIAGINASAFSASTPVTSPVLGSPVYAKPKSPLNCLYFYVWMDADATNWIWGEVEEAYLQVHVNFPDSPTVDRQWLVTKAKNVTQQREWIYVESLANITEKFQFEFTVMIKSGIGASIAIDDVKLLPGNCPGTECDCGPEGTCSFSEEGYKLCECNKRFAEKDGICSKCDCGYEGTCSFSEEGYKLCECNKKFAEKDGICAKCDCGLRGTCSFNQEGYKVCACEENYVVKNGICEECDCGPEGTCSFNKEGLKRCACKENYAVQHGRCEACDCGQNANCTFTLRWNSYEKSCICPEGYQEVDQRCEEIKSTSTVDLISTQRQLSSTVMELFSETTETIKERSTATSTSRSTLAPECYCGEHSESCYFDRNSNKVCICFSGYAQRNKTCAGICFRNSDCLNGGLCRQGEGAAFFCRCRPPFKGDSCETNELCDRLNPACEAMGAECRVDDDKEAKCVCPAGKTYHSRSGRCKGICDFNKCLHGTCEIKGENYECKCDEGFSGRFCEERKVKIPGYSYLWVVHVALFNLSGLLLVVAVCFYCNSKRYKEKVAC